MSAKAKISLLLAFLFSMVAVVLQVMTGMWLNLNSVMLGISGAFLVAAVVLDWKLYWEFLTMRTTKHGMNMGLMIILTITLLVCLNYLANRHNKTWDLTQEKLNSLSDQTTSLLRNLKEDLQIKVFYKGSPGNEERQRVKQNLQPYQEASHRVKVSFINSYVESELALQYLNDLPDREASQIFVFVEHQGRRIRTDPPFDEAAFTSSMIKATRTGESKVYFVMGHGEKDLSMEGDQGMRGFVQALEEASFKVERSI
ncbi:MAG: hypothetical protein HC883_05725 [Bdellovibrionaceae bacterium]|nr:hypothetical protein [Pseudobdellovibrionaceae bacterium]